MDVEIRRTNRKTMALEVTPDARVVVRAPMMVSDTEIRRFVNEQSAWIVKHLEQMMERMKTQDNAEPLQAEDIRKLAKEAMDVLPKKVAYYAEQMGVTYGRITIRNQKSRWGSCSSKGNLNFNCLLMLTPERVQDYVVVHELCHRKEMNHSSLFWGEVEKVLPDYKEQRTWLKEHGSQIIRRMTGY